jgi:cell filamentation protein
MREVIAMQRIETKYIFEAVLTDEINDREIYMKGVDISYYYEGYTVYKTEEL